ncbi:hypothetical protein [Pedobacter cryoconitis]|uniref:Lipoprotein n=1 Tax=Pedobacter cryoconitis TaxID=188932 RepID=A0A327SH26_9SPHI|nr:hypothetical protein [Pedobacter cryoconitis]RAJ27254.1 hypothetical protein LY11_03545 [Pedobacter cryoconitis]
MNKLLALLLICFITGSCIKVDNQPYSDYRFEVSCDNCVITIKNGFDIQSYNVSGYRSIPFNHRLPIVNVSLYTLNDMDYTTVRFTGSGYNRILFDDDLYYDDPTTVIEFNL